MAKVFLDTNLVVDIAVRKPEIKKLIHGHEAFISSLSIHILCYVSKIKIPNQHLNEFLKEYEIVNLSEKILENSLTGPTNDLEDNIQLHSAAESECDIFLTHDEKLLDMKFFGKTVVAKSL